MYKKLADSTLHKMKKQEIIELLRCAEHNADAYKATLEQHIKNVEDWVPVVRCKDCISSYEFEDWETGEKTRYCQRLRDYWVKEELWVNDNYFCCWGRKKKDV